jgi:hypothetical protein
MTNINYNNIVIYKIYCKNEDVKDVYVGSTTRFNERLREHKKSCNNNNCKNHNYKLYQIIRANGGWDNFEMVQIIKKPCKDKSEASAIERYYYELLNCTMNTFVPGRTQKEYDETNKDKKKEYYKNNKEEKIIYQNEYYQNNKDKIKQYRHEYYVKQREHKANLQKINHIKYKQDKILNYESNETRDETLKQILNI